MRKILLILILFVIGHFSLNAQNVSITGKVSNNDGSVFYSDVSVSIVGTQYTTISDLEGNFTFQDIPSGNYVLKFVLPSFEIAEITVKATENSNVGNVVLKQTTEVAVIEIGENEMSDEGSISGDNVSGLLHGSRDVFMSVAAYNLGPLRFKVRGYEADYSSVHINSIPVQDLETDRTNWSQWGGLNDAFWNRASYRGLEESDFAFGNIGGTEDISTRASEYRPGVKVTYSSANRSYRNRAMFSYSTGLKDNGLAFTLVGSRRWAEEGNVEGTFYDSWGYFMALEKKFSDKHSLNLTAFGTPTKRGSQGSSTQEVYDLTGNNYYNPYWGWQDGEKRNSRVVDTHKPMIILTDYLQINNKTWLQTSLSSSFGKYSSSSLDWFGGADDPRPDYYRYLPSYMTNPLDIAIRTAEFENGERQVDWDAMYQANYLQYKTETNVYDNGTTGNTVSGIEYIYIIGNRVSDELQFTGNSFINTEINDHIKISAGVMFRHFTMGHYAEVADLLGGDFILDNDKYAERDLLGLGDTSVLYNDIRYPNRVVREGDKYGYDYDANIRYGEVWAQAKFNYSRIDFSVSGTGAYTMFWRTGNMQNGKFPDNSLGDSQTVDFTDYGTKGSLVYKLSGKHYIIGHAAYLTKAPNFDNAYISPRTRDQLIDNLKSETIYSGDIGYALRGSKVKISLDAFYTKFQDQSSVMSFYHDGYKTFVNYAMSGINKIHQGIEFGIEANITNTLTFTAAGSLGNYYWDSRPLVTISVDNSSQIMALNDTVFVKGFLETGTPQTAFSAGLKYNAPKYWFIGANFNYIQDAFLSFNPVRRTSSAVEGVDVTSDLYSQIISEQKLPAGYTVDLFMGKSWRIQRKYYIAASLNVSNLLNNTTLITGGYEQLRYDDTVLHNVEKYGDKYYYGYGINYFLNVSFRY